MHQPTKPNHLEYGEHYSNYIFYLSLPGAWLCIKAFLEVFQAFQCKEIYQCENQNDLKRKRVIVTLAHGKLTARNIGLIYCQQTRQNKAGLVPSISSTSSQNL